MGGVRGGLHCTTAKLGLYFRSRGAKRGGWGGGGIRVGVRNFFEWSELFWCPVWVSGICTCA